MASVITIHNAQLHLSRVDGATRIVARPEWIFAKHMLEARAGHWLVQFKGLHPQSTAVDGNNELVFASVAEEDRTLLIETLTAIAHFNHRLCTMVGDLMSGAPSFAEVDSDFGDTLHVFTGRGQVDLNYETDIVCVCTESRRRVFSSRVRMQHGPIPRNGGEFGVLTYHGEHFPGAELREDDAVDFTFRFPENELQVRSLMLALMDMLFWSEGPRA